MNNIQYQAMAQLSERLGQHLQVVGENDDCVFVDVNGVTVTIGVESAFGIPSVRTYRESLATAADAPTLWEKQRKRDSKNMVKGSSGDNRPSQPNGWRRLEVFRHDQLPLPE